jgi:hypothetical protein
MSRLPYRHATVERRSVAAHAKDLAKIHHRIRGNVYPTSTLSGRTTGQFFAGLLALDLEDSKVELDWIEVAAIYPLAVSEFKTLGQKSSTHENIQSTCVKKMY